MLSRIKKWARRLNRDVHAIYLASRDPRVPWHAKVLAIAVATYALSPIDDLLIVPLGIWLVVRLIPEEIMVEHRATADKAAQRPVSRAGMVVIMMLWMFGALVLGWIVYVHWDRPN